MRGMGLQKPQQKGWGARLPPRLRVSPEERSVRAAARWVASRGNIEELHARLLVDRGPQAPLALEEDERSLLRIEHEGAADPVADPLDIVHRPLDPPGE